MHSLLFNTSSTDPVMVILISLLPSLPAFLAAISRPDVRRKWIRSWRCDMNSDGLTLTPHCPRLISSPAFSPWC